jgi:hypothetical protein
MVGRGKVVRNAGSSGCHEMTHSTRKTPSIGRDIKAEEGCHEAQITGTKNALKKAFLDTLHQNIATWLESYIQNWLSVLLSASTEIG